MFWLIIVLLIILVVVERIHRRSYRPANIDSEGKYVLITGCGSGLGHALAIELDKLGFNVFAGIHKPESEVLLKEQLSPRSVIFVLDITKEKDIDAAYNMVKEKTNVLHALVNNAGINQSIYIEWMSMEHIRKHMDVNYFGHIAMTKKFLPLLTAKKKSRVINVSSIYGFATFVTDSAHSASKYALESFSDCLRREMTHWDLHVSIIEPGNMRTPYLNKYEATSRKLWEDVSSDVKERWGAGLLEQIIDKVPDNPFASKAEDPSKAVAAICHAIMNRNPKIRYRPGWQAKFTYIIFHLLPDRILDILSYCDTSNLVPAEVERRKNEDEQTFQGK